MIRKTFIDEQLQKEYEQKGFVKVKLLDEDTINYLLAASQKYAGNGSGFASLIYLENDPVVKNEVFNIIWDKFEEAVSAIFSVHIPVCATFLIKNPGAESAVPAHQDWTIVDEAKFRSFLVWCPLMPTNADNGALHLVPGTHKLNNNPRTMPDNLFTYQQPESLVLIDKYAEMVSTALGEAIIFDNKMIHFSRANFTDMHRAVACVQMVAAEATTCHYCESRKGEPGILDICKINKDVLIELAIRDLPVKTEIIGQTKVMPQPDPYLELKSIFVPSFYDQLRRALRLNVRQRELI